MEKKQILLQGLVVICLVGMLAIPEAFAQDSGVETIAGKGQINWITNVISAKGFGIAPPSAVNAAQARALARRAAVVDARRNLLEVLKGVHIDSSTTVENFLVTSDTIRTKVEGVLQGSAIDGYVQQPDGSFEASVSIPLTGNLGDVLVPMVMGASIQQGLPAVSSTDVEERLNRLEQRVNELEQQLSASQNVSLEQEQMLEMFIQLVEAWHEYAGQTMNVHPVANTSDSIKLNKLEFELERQGRTLKTMQSRLTELADRLNSLGSAGGTAPQEKPQASKTPYTGLVIDASDTGFHPCMRPNIYSGSKTLYPGSYIDVSVAASRGFVRYYRNLAQAQRSSKAGKLPYTAKALGTGSKRRSLKLRPNDAAILQSVLEAPDNFLAQCNVVIVF